MTLLLLQSALALQDPEHFPQESAPSVFNQPELMARLRAALARELGPEVPDDFTPDMGSEDLAYLWRAGVPAAFLWVGSAPPAAFAAARSWGTTLPSNHTSRMAPDRAPTIRMAVSVVTVSARELLGGP